MEDRNFKLLREFDEESAKRGDPICGVMSIGDWKYIAGHDKDGGVCIEIDGRLSVVTSNYLRMAPLAWVEGKPVYPGDPLYRESIGQIIATGPHPHGEEGFAFLCCGSGTKTYGLSKNATWSKPKIKREVKILAYLNDQWLVYCPQDKTPPSVTDWVRVPSEDKIIVIEE